MPRAADLAAVALALACAAGAAQAQVLYKWIDERGLVQYSDKPPKNPRGPVTAIEPDVAPTPTPARVAVPAAAPKANAPKADAATKEEPPVDLATKRRTTREALETRLKQARDKLDKARKDLADASDPEPDERQVFRQTQTQGQGGMHGLSTARSNCTDVVQNGKKVRMCPAIQATDAYYERIGKLEVAVRQAEEEVEAAEQAWRRGVD